MSIDLRNEFKEEDYKAQGALLKRMSSAQLRDSLLTLQYGNLDIYSRYNDTYFEFEEKLYELSKKYSEEVLPLVKAHMKKYSRDTEEIEPAIQTVMKNYMEKFKELQDYYQINDSGYLNLKEQRLIARQDTPSSKEKSMSMMGESGSMTHSQGKAVQRAHYQGGGLHECFWVDRSLFT